MTAAEIRENVPLMAIWMADAAIREARKAVTGRTGWSDVKRAPYNLHEVEMAGEILFRMFHACSADIRIALLNMPEEMDGAMSFRDKNYFDEFVKNLDCRIRATKSTDPDLPKEAEPRKQDWTLARL